MIMRNVFDQINVGQHPLLSPTNIHLQMSENVVFRITVCAKLVQPPMLLSLLLSVRCFLCVGLI